MEHEAKYCSACGALAYLPRLTISRTLPDNKCSIAGQEESGDPTPSPNQASSLNSIDAGRSFSFMFKDESWARIAIVLGLIMLIPIAGSVVLFGYFVEVARGAACGKDLPMPRISFGAQFLSGIRFLIPYSLANIVVLSIAAVPVTLGVILLGSESEIFAIVLFVICGLFIIVAFLYFLCLIPISVAADDPSIFFNFSKGREAVGRNVENLIIFIMLSIVCGVISSLGAAACYVGLLFTMPIGYIIKAHIAGQMGGLMIQPIRKNEIVPLETGESAMKDRHE
ncbi:MAG TPA: DUF4013 domain-containing protein [bacterium]|nr:DUF4013 domain-containing protein [bacterium]